MSFLKDGFKRFSAAYVRFVERQGFFVILLLCVGVITGTAAWTNQHPPAEVVAPTPPVNDAASAAQLMQQSLADASTSTPLPAATLVIWQKPLQNISVLRGFDASRLVQSGVTGIWRLHDALDLRCNTGDPVFAMADGTVIEVVQNDLLGASMTIDHGQGILAQYSGMSLTAGMQVNDPVSVGQTIGFAGNGMLDESDMVPHLHLRVTRDGIAIDPLSLLPHT